MNVSSASRVHAGCRLSATKFAHQNFFRSSRRQVSSSSSADSWQEEEQVVAQKLTEAKAELVRMGFHGPSIWTQVICWGDHDQFQHVNNVHYLRFTESARMRFAERALAAKLSPERREQMVKGTGESFILHSVSLRYKRPVMYPDTLLVGTQPILPLGKDRFSLKNALFSVAQNAVIATSEQINVCYDYRKLSKIAMPADFQQALEELTGGVSTP